MSWSGGGHGGSAGLATGPLSEMTQRGFLAWNASPTQMVNTGTIALSGSLYVMKLFTPSAISVTNASVLVSVIGATLTSGQNLLTLYNAAGTKLADTPSQDVAWTATGMKQAAFTGGPYVIPAGAFWVSLLSNGTTPATFRNLNAPATGYNASPSGILSGANLFWSVNGTAVTSTSNLTLASNSNAASIAYWIGVS